MQLLARDLRPVSIALIWMSATIGAVVGAAAASDGPDEVSFPTADGGEIHALLWGDGDHGVLLAHGKVFDKESWSPLAPRLAGAGYTVLAIDFRGYGQSRAGTEGGKLYLDVIAGISHLESIGANRISVVGASMGGGAAARAAVEVEGGEIDRLVLLAPAAIPKPEDMHANQIVYVTAEGDPSLDRTRALFARAPEPKSLELVPGTAHAQHLFETEHAEALITAILAALSD